MQLLPIGIQDFGKLRELNALYIDKTRYIYELYKGSGYYFLSRPRRFGKSLLVSTLESLFLGKRALFSGLWIEDKISWQEHPIVHISFNTIGYRELGLEQAIIRVLDKIAGQYGIVLSEPAMSLRFLELLEKLGSGGRRVVILIDEYDKPIIDYLEDISRASENRDILKTFYSIIKNADTWIRMLFITGVSKFNRVSIFSDLNNLEDLTLAPDWEALAGYTQQELEHYFEAHIDQLAKKLKLDKAQTLLQIKSWYNGYSWAATQQVYNPFSILNHFKQQRFANFWFQTGTPTFLIKLLKAGMHYELENLVVGETLFESYDLETLDYRALLFQTGYLSVKQVTADGNYELGYPNREVRDAMYQHLMGGFRYASPLDSQPLLAGIKNALENGDTAQFIRQINLLFASIPHQIFLEKQEAFFHAILHITFKALNMYVESEVSRSRGRVDCVVQTKQFVYIMEFKLDESAEAALDQIRRQQYGSSYLHQGKSVMALGINFSSRNKAVADWKVLPYEELISG
ncbi:MAG: AAA family ATPase [Bacteroidetes bacterium]|nr:MAG: AAA family ATPase [Bacteroidota bacterium]